VKVETNEKLERKAGKKGGACIRHAPRIEGGMKRKKRVRLQ